VTVGLFPVLFGLWFVAALVVGFTGALERLHPPEPQAIVIGLTATLIVARLTWRSFREWLDRLPWQGLVALHLFRFVGADFLVLYRQGELPRDFAVPAGTGDVIVAVLAVLLLAASGFGRKPFRFLLIWNVLGLADILMVVVEGARSGLADPPSMAALLRLPLSLLPTFYVPIVIASHLLLVRKIHILRNEREPR
jgi:hypothetical protein